MTNIEAAAIAIHELEVLAIDGVIDADDHSWEIKLGGRECITIEWFYAEASSSITLHMPTCDVGPRPDPSADVITACRAAKEAAMKASPW